MSLRDLYPQPDVPYQIAAPETTPTSLAELPGVGALATDSEIETYVRENYGYMGSFLNVPEVRDVLFEAARWGYDEQKLYGKLSQTQWWQTTSASQRTWQQLTSEDPAEARRQVEQTAALVQNRARALGLAGGDVADLALQATANGWTDAQQVDQLLRNVNWSTIQAGDLTDHRDSVKAIGGNYLVAVSDSTAQQYAERIASGELTLEGVRSAMAQQAKQRFGWMASQIDQGMTVKDYISPVRDVIASELEMAPEAIDMMDSKWLSMIERVDDKGERRSATLHEAMLTARQQPEWKSTSHAQTQMAKVSKLMADTFGRSAT